MADDGGKVTEFDFHDYQGWLSISIDRTTFEKVLKTLQEHSDSEELAEVEVSEVWQLLIYDSSRRPAARASSWWKDRLWLIGCGVISFLIAIVLIMGVLAIAGLVPLPR